MKRLSVLVAILLVSRPAPGQVSQTGTVETAKSYSIVSSLLHETRRFDVTLPRGYDRQKAERYPVLFILDGEFEGQVASAVAGFYADAAMLPKTIVVSIRNVDRLRDLTPAPIAGFEPPPGANGGADAFLRFFAQELLPYIDNTYRTAPMRVLVGHSLGGLFALHAFSQRPSLFTGYLVMEPSEWWNNQEPHRAAEAALLRPESRRARLVTVNAQHLDADTTSWGGQKPMVRELRVTGDTHSSMAAVGMLTGLRTMFEDFRPSVWRPGTRPIAMLERYDSLKARLGYSPTIPSDAFDQVFDMSVKSRRFDDAQAVIDRLVRTEGESQITRTMRAKLASERSQPMNPKFVQLEIASHRPTAAEASRFIGHWEMADGSGSHTVDIRAAGDTIIVHDRIPFPGDQPFDADDPVVQITNDGSLEWGLPFFRGLAALLVLHATIESDGTMVVTRQSRGWVPIGPAPEFEIVERFRRK